MTVSHWRRAAASPRIIERDLCIVGAGVAGVGAAIWASRAGASSCILERHTLASGASSRNAGFLMRGAADHYADAIRLYGRDHAKLVWKWSEDNLALLRAEGIESLPSYRRVPSCLLALTPAQELELRASLDLLIADGFDASWQHRGTDSLWSANPLPEEGGGGGRRWAATETVTGTQATAAGGELADLRSPFASDNVTPHLRGGLLNPHDASINPVEMMRLLASKLPEPPIENQEVFAIESDPGASDRVLVRATDVVVKARHVLLCTNAYAGLLSPSLARLVTPRRGQMLALRGPHLRLDASYYANHGSEYLRQTADGTVVVGGCRTYFADRELGYEDKTTGYVQEAIESFARAMLGADWEISARWSGTMGFSPDGLPLVGPVPDLDPAHSFSPVQSSSLAQRASPDAPRSRVWFCGGFTGHGMSLGFNTARSAVEGILAREAIPRPFDLRRTL